MTPEQELESYKQTLADLHRHAVDDIRRWRDAGLSYGAVYELVSSWHGEKISLGKLVEELRGLCTAACCKVLEEHGIDPQSVLLKHLNPHKESR